MSKQVNDTTNGKYYYRKEVSEHKVSIRTLHSMDKIGNRILNRVFSHLPAVFESECPKKYNVLPESCGRKRYIPSLNWLSWNFFHRNYYVHPQIRKGFEGDEIDLEQFLDDTIFFPTDTHHNNLIFLSGPVGCGKTALINFIITKHGNEIWNNNTWFLRYNVNSQNKNQSK